MTDHITHPTQPLIPRRTTPRPPVDVCGAVPLGARFGPDEARCMLKPYHLGTRQHRNARGETWGLVLRPIDRVEERRRLGS